MANPRDAAIVTGASRGIGAATARLLASRGLAVLVNYASDADAAGGVVAGIRESGGVALAFHADVSKEAEVAAMFDAATRDLGYVAALVNNAGVTGGFGRLEDVSVASVEEVLAVNVLGAILCAREAVRRMSTRRNGRGGAIVNVGSLAARIGSAGEWVHYAASKGAVHTLTIGLAREVAADGIRVNCLAPGLVDTELHAASGQPDRLERLRPGIPLQRPGTAEEVAAGIAWLLSEESSYVTGAILEMGGGR
ncbi:MAG: SDR family oxidoreductase [Deltaproteobacteria bacterium]|nr:MAG: SDR family oxidoreductase [Deltaproteobacteria bacterium]